MLTIKAHNIETKSYYSLYSYATTSTARSVYIIGGWTGKENRISTIAKYNNAIWTNAGNLKEVRSAHGAITLEGLTMVIGGQLSDKNSLS